MIIIGPTLLLLSTVGAKIMNVITEMWSYRVLRAKVSELALLQDHHVLPDGVQMSHNLLHRDLLPDTAASN